jgi:LemA protein
VKEAWSNIGVVTRRKVALVNQLIEMVHEYQESEKLVMLKISDDLTTNSVQRANQQSGTVLAAINGIAQRYPELKASEQYNHLASAINGSEIDLQNIRRTYNKVTREYNVARTSIPDVFYSQFLGFHAAPYLSLDAAESPDASVQQPMISDDGERVSELLGMAGRAARNLAAQGRLLAEKSVARVQGQIDTQFTYLDVERKPKGPVSRAELDQLFQSGAINPETDIFMAGAPNWGKYGEL